MDHQYHYLIRSKGCKLKFFVLIRGVIVLSLAFASTVIFADETKVFEIRYSSLLKKEISVRNIYTFSVQEYLPPHNIDLSGNDRYLGENAPEFVISGFLTAFLNEELDVALSFVDEHKRKDILSHSNDKLKEAIDFSKHFYFDRDVYITHKAAISNIIVLSVASYAKDTKKLVLRWSYYIAQEGTQWKLTSQPQSDLASAISFHFPFEDNEVVRKTITGVRTPIPDN